MTVRIKAKKIQRGHSIPGLDNAYVINVERAKDNLYMTTPGSGIFNIAADEDMVLITFNDAEGNEGYLMVDKNHPIDVDHEEPQWVGDW